MLNSKTEICIFYEYYVYNTVLIILISPVWYLKYGWQMQIAVG